MISIMLVDDHQMFRDGLKFALSQIDDFEIVGEAADGKYFLEKVKDLNPDLVLMDIGMPKIDGVEATEKVVELFPNINVIGLSMFGDVEYYQKMVAAGAKGFLMKEASVDELETGIREVMKGGTYFSQELLQKIITHMANPNVQSSQNGVVSLTRREEEVLNLICKGYDNKEIADQLFISQKTVEGHKTNLLSKTYTKNAINLMLFAIKHRLVDFQLPKE